VLRPRSGRVPDRADRARRLIARRLTALALVALLALAAGCGSDSTSGSGDQLGDALGYMPANSLVVVAIDTDVKGDQYRNVDALLQKFPFGGQVKSQLEQSINQRGVSYDKDIKPLLGAPAVLGTADAATINNSSGGATADKWVVAFPTKDGDKLRDFVKKDGDEAGQVGGETAYKSGDMLLVVKGDTMVGSEDRGQLEAALKRADDGSGLKEDRFDAAFNGLPEKALVRSWVDVQALLGSDPQAAAARKVKYVGAMRVSGQTLTADADGVSLDAFLATEGVSPADLPVAAGAEAPGVVRRKGDIGFAIRDLRQSIRFAESVAKVVDPAGFAKYQKDKLAAGKDAGVNVDKDVIDKLEGASYLSVDLGGQAAFRADVEDPQALGATLDKLGKSGGLGELKLKKGRAGFYDAVSEDGTRFVIGMSQDHLVIAPDEQRALEMAALKPQPVAGAQGAVAANADAKAIASQVIQQKGGQGALASTLFTGPLGSLDGWMRAEPDGLRAHLKLKIE
jgi:hypothetical protein